MNDDILAAHSHCRRNRDELHRSELAGCCYCCHIFPPAGIWEWIDDNRTAMCPYCGIDSVVPSAAGFPITAEFMRRMAMHWFDGPRRPRDWARPFAPVVAEQGGDVVASNEFAFHEAEYRRLVSELETARAVSNLPDEPSAGDALHELLVCLRLRTL